MEQNIAFDIDGVLANFTRGFTRIAFDLFGTPVGDGQSQETWFFEAYPQLGLTKEQCGFTDGPIWNEVRTSQDFWYDLDPFNASVMHRIDRIKNKIFITNRLGVDPLQQTVDWLEQWGVLGPQVIVAEQKVPVALEYNVVAMTDDYIKNCNELKGVVKFMALHYAPYNKIHHEDWTSRGGEIMLSVDHFINECEKRGYVEYD